MKKLTRLLSLFALTLWAAALPLSVAAQQAEPSTTITSEVFASLPPEVQERLRDKYKAYREAASKNEELKQVRDQRKADLRADKSLPDHVRAEQLYRAEVSYIFESRKLVEKQRRPLVEEIVKAAADPVKKDGISSSDGTDANSRENSGWASDHDYSATSQEADRVAEIARTLGFETADKNGGSTVDIEALNMTLNRDMELEKAPPGSQLYKDKLRAMATNKETFTSQSMADGQPGKNAVFGQDQLNKAAEMRALENPTLAGVEGANADAWQRYVKSNRKLLDKWKGKLPPDMDDPAHPVRQALDRHEETKDMSGAEYEAMMRRMKRRHDPSSLGINSDEKLKALINVQNEVTDTIIRQMDTEAVQERAAMTVEAEKAKADSRALASEIDAIRAAGDGDELSVDREARIQELSAKREALEADAAEKTRQVQDSFMRHQATIDANAALGVAVSDSAVLASEQVPGKEGLDPDFMKPSAANDNVAVGPTSMSSDHDFSGTDGGTNARTRLNRGADKVFGTGMKGMDYWDKLQKAREVTDKIGKELYDGNYAKAWENTKDMVGEELYNHAKDKVMEKLIPGYGQLSGAFDMGWMTGELLGKLPVSKDGRTINDMVEAQMRTTFFAGQDAASGAQERDAAIKRVLIDNVQQGKVQLPEGAKFGDVYAQVRSNMDAGRAPFQDIAFRPGGALLAEAEKAVDEPDVKAKPVPADDPWAYDADAGGTDAPIRVVQNDRSPEEEYAIRQRLKQMAEYEKAQNEGMMQQQFAEAAQARAEEERRKEQERAQFQASMQALAGGIASTMQSMQAYDAQVDAQIAANNQKFDNLVSDMNQRYKNRPTAAQLMNQSGIGAYGISNQQLAQQAEQQRSRGGGNVVNWVDSLDEGNAKRQQYNQYGQARQQTGSSGFDRSYDIDQERLDKAASRVTLNDKQIDIFAQMCNDLRAQGAQVQAAECLAMGKQGVAVASNLHQANNLDDFVRRYCSWAANDEQRKDCEPKARAEFQRRMGK
ncbi:hypothetical protein [Kordiimonas sp.]|uniref:hypothetical protein n=1 Tax=Kordiimonas sp. TaxID=1970157 RepID=UPI003A94B391